MNDLTQIYSSLKKILSSAERIILAFVPGKDFFIPKKIFHPKKDFSSPPGKELLSPIYYPIK
jgi:ethanolamine utilization microcompartment shell protein EutS